MEQENPYTGMLDIMGKAAGGAKTVACLIGTVAKVSPLTVRAGGLEIDAENIMLNPVLRAGYKRTAKFGDQTAELTLMNGELRSGDIVLLIPGADLQEFYLACRLEAADG
jgi:hypothetical protein